MIHGIMTPSNTKIYQFSNQYVVTNTVKGFRKVQVSTVVSIAPFKRSSGDDLRPKQVFKGFRNSFRRQYR